MRTVIFVLTLLIISCRPRSGVSDGTMTTETNRQVQIDSNKVRPMVDQYTRGRLTFERHCVNCHAPVHGHAWDAHTFDHIFESMPKPFNDYFSKYLFDTKKLRDSGDSYAIKVHSDWDSHYDHSFQDTLGLDDIEDLITYIQVGIKQRQIN